MNLIACFLVAGTLICPGVESVRAQGLGLLAPGHVIGNGGTANPGEATDYALSSVFARQCTASGGFLISLGGGTAQCSTDPNSTATLNGGPLTINPTGGNGAITAQFFDANYGISILNIPAGAPGSYSAPSAIAGTNRYGPTADSSDNPDGIYGILWYTSAHNFTGGGAALRGNVYTVPVITATIASGGANNQVGDVLTIVGGTCTTLLNTSPKFVVSTVSGGAVTAVTYQNQSACSVYPSNPVSTTSSRGGATPPTLNLTVTGPSVTNLIGVYGRALHSSPGTVTDSIGLYADGCYNAGGGTLTNCKNVWLQPPYTASANSYGLWFNGNYGTAGLATSGGASIGVVSGSNLSIQLAGSNVAMFLAGGWMQVTGDLTNQFIAIGGTNKRAAYAAGRAVNEGFFGVAGVANDFFTGTAGGDTVLAANSNIWLATNLAGTPIGAVNIDNGSGKVTIFAGLGIGGSAQATGLRVTNAFVNPNANGQAEIGASSTVGAMFGGQGSVSDFALVNKTGVTVCSNTTGNTTLNCALLQVTTTFTAPDSGTWSSTGISAVAVNHTGTAGAGYAGFVAQSSAPSAPAGGFRLYADATGRLSWIRQSDGFSRTFDATLTASRVFTLQDANYTIIGRDTTDTLTNKTFDTAGTGNVFKINGTTITAVSPAVATLVGNTRAINTTAPITGGGDLSADRTIACPTCVTSAGSLTANQLVIGSGSQGEQALGTLGTTTTVLHGNASGAPTFAAVVSADLNITTTTCTNQFVTAISAGAVGTCTTDTLASAQHANQGTTTTVLHGNAAGNPSWGAVSLTADVTGTLPVGNGGTGTTTFTANGVLYGNTTSAVQVTAQGGTNTILIANAGAPSFSATPKVNTSLGVPIIGPISDGTTALKLTKADLSTAVVTMDTTNSRVGILATPTDTLDVGGAIRVTTNVSFDATLGGRIYKSAVNGLSMQGVTGSANDWAVFTVVGQALMRNPTGTNVIATDSGVALTIGGSNDPGQGNLAIVKHTCATAPGTGALSLCVAAGTNAGTCKLVALAGTSTTPVTIVDNVGGSC